MCVTLNCLCFTTQPWQWELLGMYIPAQFLQNVASGQLYFHGVSLICLLCGRAESLPIHITNASLSNDISSKLELSF